MYRTLRVLPLLLLALACAKSTVSPSVRLDFVGGGRFTSSTRTLSPTAPADTLASKIYANATDTTVVLRRLQILLTSSPRTPILYSSSGIALTQPAPDPRLVYLDSILLPGTKDLAFTNLISARTTSGDDLWEYKVTDTLRQSASRAYHLLLRRPDSMAVVQNYRLFLSPVPYKSGAALTPAQNRAFAYVGLRQGLLLPHFAVANKSVANQALVDLVCIASGTDVRLASTASTNITVTNKPAQLTELRSTALGISDFSNFTTNVLLEPAFNNGGTYGAAGGSFDAFVTAPLVKGTVVAFRITDQKTKTRQYGAILVTDIVRTPTAIITCQVAVEK